MTSTHRNSSSRSYLNRILYILPPLVIILFLGTYSSPYTYLSTHQQSVGVSKESCDKLYPLRKENDESQNTAVESNSIVVKDKETQSDGEKLENEEDTINQIHLKNVQAVDRDLNGVTVDVTYNLNVPSDWYDSFETTSPSYNQTMSKLHGHDIWDMDDTLIHVSMEESKSSNEPSLSSFLDFLQLTNSSYKLIGSPLDYPTLKQLIGEIKPKIFLEVGVYQGMTSTFVARYFKSNDEYKDSYVISMDTWLLDLQFTWNGIKSKHVKETQTASYFTGTSKRQGGYSTMYYHFLMNCIKSKATDRIIPLPTASQNGAMTLLSHGIRPDFIYVDASHSNPDVLIDYENFYTILRPGGVIAFDDTGVEAVRAALNALVKKYDLDLHESHKQAYVYKKKEKYE